MLSWNDAIVHDGVEGVIQSMIELCVSEDSNKKPAAEVLPNYVPGHEEIVNDATEAMPNSVPQQGEIINEAAEAMPNSVTEQGEIINEVSTTDIDVCGVTDGNNVETANVVINEDRVFWRDSRNVWVDMRLFVVHKKNANPT